MPSLYLTAYNSAEAVPIFVKKGIAYLMPGRVSAPAIFVKTSEYFHYSVAYIQMAVITCGLKIVTEIDSGYHAIFKQIKPSRYFNQPVVTLRFGKLTELEVTNLKAMGLVRDLTNPNLFVGMLGPEHLPTIWKMNPVEDRVRPGHIGSDAYFAWCYLIKGVQAFITVRNNTDGRVNLRYSLKQSVKFDKEGDILRIGKDVFKGKHGFTSGRSIITTNDVFLHPPVQDLSHFPGSFTDLNDAKAMPTSTTGFLFPYFHGLNTPDKEVAGEVFKRLFPTVIASTPEMSEVFMRNIMAGNRSLCFSEAGMALAHIYRILNLSLEVPECSLSILMKGHSYQGMIMSCAPDTELHMYNHTYIAGEILAEVKKIDLLESQAEKIVELLSGAMDVDGVVRVEYTKDDFLTSRSALRKWNSVNRMAYTATDILKSVKEILKTMDFADTFAPITAANTQRALTAMISKDFTGLTDFPAYLGGNVLNDTGSITEALSMFGAMAPTCNVGQEKGSTTIFIPAIDKEDRNLVKVEGKRPLQYLPFYSAPIGTAVQQWNKLINSGKILIPMGRRDKKEFANLQRAIFQVGSSTELDTMYSGLKVLTEEARVAAKVGGKRKRPDGDDVQVVKRGRVMEQEGLDDM